MDLDSPQVPIDPFKAVKVNTVRRAYSLKEKKAVVNRVDHLCATDSSMNITKAMKSLRLPNYYYARWKKDIIKADHILSTRVVRSVGSPDSASSSESFIPTDTTRKLHHGRVGFLSTHSKTLGDKITELRARGLQVSVDTVIREANKISPTFKNKSSPAKRFVARRFCISIGLSHRAPTHVAQKHPAQTEALAKAFIELVRERVRHMPPDAVANMDQTPIPFAYNSRRTLARRGSSSIHLLAPGEKERATFNATITLAGGKLKPLVVFKGKPGGRIEKRDFPTFSDDGFWEVQKNAWCDERVMLVWVYKVLAPWKKGLKEKY
eukprot:scaffold8927_cov71-Cyclotella_meneghiniana.AAC.1